jgi:hypothetical protein
MSALLIRPLRESSGLANDIKKMGWAGEPTSNSSFATEHYEVWVLDIGEWTLKSSWRDFELAWTVARVHAGPVRIARAMCEDGQEIERKIVAELRVAGKEAAPATIGWESVSATSENRT